MTSHCEAAPVGKSPAFKSVTSESFLRARRSVARYWQPFGSRGLNAVPPPRSKTRAPEGMNWAANAARRSAFFLGDDRVARSGGNSSARLVLTCRFMEPRRLWRNQDMAANQLQLPNQTRD